MIHPKKSNNVKCQWIKRNKLFGFDWKSQIKTNNYLFFHLLSAKTHVKMVQKMSQNAQYSTLFGIMYLTLKKVFVLHSKRIGWPDSIQFVFRIPNLTWKLKKRVRFSNVCSWFIFRSRTDAGCWLTKSWTPKTIFWRSLRHSICSIAAFFASLYL